MIAERLQLDGHTDLYLSLISDQDAHAIREFTNTNPDTIHPCFQATEITELRATRWANAYAEHVQANTGMPYFVHTTQDEVAGLIWVGERRERYSEVQYAIAAPFRGRGLAALAVNTVLEQAKSEWGLDRVGLHIDKTNRASQSVAAKIGAVFRNDFRTDFGDSVIPMQYWDKEL